jgi:hypothetical protein
MVKKNLVDIIFFITVALEELSIHPIAALVLSAKNKAGR